MAQIVRVLFTTEHQDPKHFMVSELAHLGFTVLCHPIHRLLQAVEQERPDLLIMDNDAPTRDTFESLSTLNALNPIPVIIFSAQQEGCAIQQAIDVGVSAYIVNGLYPGRIKSIVDVAIARFEQNRQLRERLDNTNAKLEEVNLLAQAKKLLIKHQGLDEPSAHRALRKMAMDRRERLATVARNTIKALALMPSD